MSSHAKFSRERVKTHLAQPNGRVGIIQSGGERNWSTNNVTNLLEVALAMAW